MCRCMVLEQRQLIISFRVVVIEKRWPIKLETPRGSASPNLGVDVLRPALVETSLLMSERKTRKILLVLNSLRTTYGLLIAFTCIYILNASKRYPYRFSSDRVQHKADSF